MHRYIVTELLQSDCHYTVTSPLQYYSTAELPACIIVTASEQNSCVTTELRLKKILKPIKLQRYAEFKIQNSSVIAELLRYY